MPSADPVVSPREDVGERVMEPPGGRAGRPEGAVQIPTLPEPLPATPAGRLGESVFSGHVDEEAHRRRRPFVPPPRAGDLAPARGPWHHGWRVMAGRGGEERG